MGHLALKVLLTLFLIGDGGQAPSKRRRDPAPLTVYGRMYYLFAVALWPETRGIQNVLDSLLVPKAKGARAEDFMDTTLMEEIRKSGFMEKLQGVKG
jgi:hypothetical protein